MIIKLLADYLTALGAEDPTGASLRAVSASIIESLVPLVRPLLSAGAPIPQATCRLLLLVLPQSPAQVLEPLVSAPALNLVLDLLPPRSDAALNILAFQLFLSVLKSDVADVGEFLKAHAGVSLRACMPKLRELQEYELLVDALDVCQRLIGSEEVLVADGSPRRVWMEAWCSLIPLCSTCLSLRACAPRSLPPYTHTFLDRRM